MMHKASMPCNAFVALPALVLLGYGWFIRMTYCVVSITQHPRGGYVAVMDFSRKSLDSFIEHLEAAGWMSCESPG